MAVFYNEVISDGDLGGFCCWLFSISSECSRDALNLLMLVLPGFLGTTGFNCGFTKLLLLFGEFRISWDDEDEDDEDIVDDVDDVKLFGE